MTTNTKINMMRGTTKGYEKIACEVNKVIENGSVVAFECVYNGIASQCQSAETALDWFFHRTREIA